MFIQRVKMALNNRLKNSVVFFGLILLLSSCCFLQSDKICITDAKIAAGIDDKLMPIQVTNLFPKGTSQVFCWFQWKNAQVNIPIIAKWHYITDNIPILDYTFKIPRKKGSGSVSLSMPKDKILPRGEYKIDLIFNNKTLKFLTFKVE